MKKILIAALGILALVLPSCTNHQNTQAAIITNAVENYKDYAKIIAIPDIVNDLLNDPVTPTVGPRDANKAVVVFFDYGCVVSVLKFLKKLINLLKKILVSSLSLRLILRQKEMLR